MDCEIRTANYFTPKWKYSHFISHFSRVRLCVIPETAAHHAPPSLGFSRQNTGVGCHFLLQCMRVKCESEVAQSCPTSRSHGLQPTRLLHPWDFPSKNTGVGCHCLLCPALYYLSKSWQETDCHRKVKERLKTQVKYRKT